MMDNTAKYITIGVVVGVFLLTTLASCLGGGYYASVNRGRHHRGELPIKVPCYFVCFYKLLKFCLFCNFRRHRGGVVEKGGPTAGAAAAAVGMGPQTTGRVPVGDAMV